MRRIWGNGWSQWDYYLLYALQMLYITEYGHPDSQTMIGRGYVDGNSSYKQTGGTLQYGNNTFGETTGKVQMSYRGIEDFWGNYFNWIDGLYSDASRNILIRNKGFNDTGAGYINVGNGGNANIGGWIGEIQPFEDAGFIIRATTGGSASSRLYDYGSLSAGRLPYFGGNLSDGSAAGAFQFRLYYSAAISFAHLSARLSF